jgi:hypothetical protein
MIAFYDYEFNCILVENKVIRWQFTKLYNGIGTFVAYLPATSDAVRLVMENDYLVCRFGGEYGVVTGKEIGSELVIYGRTLNWLLSKRVTLPRESSVCYTGDFVQNIFEEAYSGSEGIVFGSMQKGTENSFCVSAPKPMSALVFDALSLDKLGNELVFDKENRRWVFNLLKGEDRSLLISEINKNASSVNITENISEIANLCYYKTKNGYQSSGERLDGLYHFETYVSSDDKEDADARLSESRKESSVKLNTQGIWYKRDYNLGDTVRMQIVKGNYRCAKRLRITGVEMSCDVTGYKEKPVFEEI